VQLLFAAALQAAGLLTAVVLAFLSHEPGLRLFHRQHLGDQQIHHDEGLCTVYSFAFVLRKGLE
jgi:hypothetical protein